MNGPNVTFEMFASDEALSTPVRVAGIGPYALFGLVSAGGVDRFSVGRRDFASARLFCEVGNRDGDFGHGAGCAAGGAGGGECLCVGVWHGEGGGVDAGGGGNELGLGGVGEVVAVHVLGRGPGLDERVGGGGGGRAGGDHERGWGEVGEVDGRLGKVGETEGGVWGVIEEGGVPGRVVVEGGGVECPEVGLGLVREHGEFAAEHSVDVGHAWWAERERPAALRMV